MTDFENDQTTQADDDNAVIRDLREKAKEAETLRRELAEIKAAQEQQAKAQALQSQIDEVGIPPEKQESFKKLAERFIEDEPTPDALRALADEYGFQTVADAKQAEAAAIEQAGNLTAGPAFKN
jgi:endonuclease III